MNNALTLPPSTQGPRGAAARTDQALARREDVTPGIPWDEIRKVCRSALAAGLLPSSIQREEQAVAIALKARELGIPPMQGFSQIHVIQGVPSCSAQLMLALAYKHLPEFDLQVIESTAKKATMTFRRDRSHSSVTLTYTIEQAANAGLTSKGNWKSHPDDMLRNRVVSKGLKMVAPDVFAGLYLPDEVEEAGGLPATEVEPVDVPRSGRPAGHEQPPIDVPATNGAAPEPVGPAERTRFLDLMREVEETVIRKAITIPKATTPAMTAGAWVRRETGVSAGDLLHAITDGRLDRATFDTEYAKVDALVAANRAEAPREPGGDDAYDAPSEAPTK